MDNILISTEKTEPEILDDLYKLLGVDPKATSEEIHKAYQKIAKKHHPDLHKGVESVYFSRVKFAHDILIDPTERAIYDATGYVKQTDSDKIEAVGVIQQAALKAFQSFGPEVDVLSEIITYIEGQLASSNLQLSTIVGQIEHRTKLNTRMIENISKYWLGSPTVKSALLYMYSEAVNQDANNISEVKAKGLAVAKPLNLALQMLEDTNYEIPVIKNVSSFLPRVGGNPSDPFDWRVVRTQV